MSSEKKFDSFDLPVCFIGDAVNRLVSVPTSRSDWREAKRIVSRFQRDLSHSRLAKTVFVVNGVKIWPLKGR